MDKNYSTLLYSFVVIILLAGLLLTDCWAISGLIVALAILHGLRLVWIHGQIWWHMKHSKVAKKERFFLFLVSLMVLFLATGTALYMWAFYEEGNDNYSFKFTNAEYLLRSLLCSFQLFTANIDSNVFDGISKHKFIKGAISIQAVLSFTCSLAALISLAYARVKAFIKLHRQTIVDNEHNHLYVFFGMNEPSRLLAKSIREKEKEQALIAFVENPQMDDEDKSGWNNIISMFTHRRNTFTEVEKFNARVTFTETKLCDVEMEQKEQTDVFSELNLLKLKELIQNLATTKESRLHIFFLSENEDENIRSISVLASDTTIHQVNTQLHLCIYCHARRNGLNRVIEDIAVKRALEVRIIDSSHLAVELLKADEKNHPARLVDVDNDNPTTVKSEFNALVVGFDEVGQDALKFLYEFGAFVDSDGTPKHEMRSPFHCIATDRRMDELQGYFTAFAPAAMTRWNKDGSNLIELKQCDCKSSDFFTSVLNTDFSRKLNYVVIAVGDDELGMTLAIQMLIHIRREREDLSKLRIYVRSYHTEKEAYMQKIADFYNDGYRKDCKKEKFKTEAIIIPFGQKEKIYTYEMIINEELTLKGIKFHEGYARLRGENPSWNKRRADAMNKASLDSLRSLRRKEHQDLANALHADTKIDLLLRSMPKDLNWEDFFRRYFNDENKALYEGEYDKIKYTFLNDYENKAILNLARLEHLRWNASHEMLGYTKACVGLHSCDERTRQHNCLRPWQELDDESRATLNSDWPCDYKLFDFCVVDISILLNKEKLLKQ